MKNILVLFFLLLSIKSKSQTADTMSTSERYDRYINPNWIYVTESVDADRWYIRSKYESKLKGKIKIWVKIYQQGKETNGSTGKATYLLQLASVDCTNKRVAIVSRAYYYSDTDKLIDNEETNVEQYRQVIPETVMETVVDKICILYNK